MPREKLDFKVALDVDEVEGVSREVTKEEQSEVGTKDESDKKEKNEVGIKENDKIEKRDNDEEEQEIINDKEKSKKSKSRKNERKPKVEPRNKQSGAGSKIKSAFTYAIIIGLSIGGSSVVQEYKSLLTGETDIEATEIDRDEFTFSY
ncbi:hypothetical protein R3X26_17725 [Vibrio sp. TH_r3]|uniref:hypothetical protein n=1 Tax=Vibrio sp. TH_r3 TaxID=3082084 RepID=UPI002953CAC1|nr:hypothetical protein [Vibrio sp. TH_r3]MDV7106239.1 hypothetical protein [Vibrio sp. TH_r3]